MAVRRFQRIKESERNDADNQIGRIVERYIVILDDDLAYADQISFARPDLLKWQPHRDNPLFRVRERQIKQLKHSNVFTVTVTYSTETPPQHPLDEPAKVKWSTVNITVPVTHDPNTGRPIVSPNGNLIEGITENVNLRQAVVTKNIGNLPDWFDSYQEGCLNSDAVTLDRRRYRPRTLKLDHVEIGEWVPGYDPEYRVLTMRITVKPSTWIRRFANADVVERELRYDPEKPGAAMRTALVPILADNGQPITKPQFLDDDGRRHRVDWLGNPVTLQQEYEALRIGIPIETFVKSPLSPEDISDRPADTLLVLPFSRLPLT